MPRWNMMPPWKRSLIAGALLLAVAGAVASLHSTDSSLVARTVSLGAINLPFNASVDTRAGRAIIVTSPQGPVSICRIFVLDMKSGAVVGSVPVGTVSLATALDERSGHVFVSSGNTGRGRVYMVDVRTGVLVRRVTVGVFPSAMAVDEYTARLFVVNANITDATYGAGGIDADRGSVSVLDTRSGRVLRTVTVGRLPSTPVVDARAGRVLVINTGSNSISVLDAHNGRVLHTIPIAETPNAPSPIALDERTGRAFALSGSSIMAIDIGSGRVLRAVRTGPATDIAVDEKAGRVLVASPRSNALSMLDARSGRLLHVVRLPAPEWITLDERSGSALVAAKRATVMLDTRRGRVRYAVPLDPYAGVTPDTREGRLFVVNSYSIGVLDARTGRRLRTLTFGLKPSLPGVDQMFAPLSISVDEPARRAFVIDYNHRRVSSLDPRSGAILRTATVPPQPMFTLVDGRTGRALLLSLGGTESVPDPWGWLPGWLRRHLPFLPNSRSRTRVVPASVSVLDATR